MEIISYVGSCSTTRQIKSTFLQYMPIFKNSRKRIKKSYDIGFMNTSSYKNSARAVSVSTSNLLNFRSFQFKAQIIKKTKVLFKNAVKSVLNNWKIFAFAILLCSIPLCVYQIFCNFENKSNPLSLNDERIDEFELLNKQMQIFALESYNDIEDDGSVIGAQTTYSFKKPVTYSTYTVKQGDTISGIIKKFNLNNISTLIAVNNIDNVRTLNAGRKLTIPSVDGLFYRVQKGDSIQSVVKKYNVSIEDLLDVNDLESEVLSVGKNLFIPGAKLDKTTLKNAMGDTFINPLRNSAWRLTSRCGYRANPFTGVRQYHPGIDLAISQGTPIYAALSGKVVACGWSNVYGNYVIIDHQNGYQSLYGHMYKKLCKLNQEVTTNTKIGLVGNTGYSTGPHLHFTVYKNGKVIDPLTLIK